MKRDSTLRFATAAAVLAVLGTAVHAQEKYSLKTPSGIAFSDFKGYEDWSVISSARTDEVLKVIVGNPTMIKAFRGRRARQRQAVSGRLQSRQAPVEL